MIEIKKKILYLTWGENIVDYGIFESQVFQKLLQLSKSGKYDFFVHAGVPAGKKYFENRKTYIEKLEAIGERFEKRNIPFSYSRIFKISPYFHAKWWALWTFHLPYLLTFRAAVKRNKINLIHCRSYHAALLAIVARLLFRLNYKLVFDTRGLVPEEGVLIGAFSGKSLSYRLWKMLEKFMFDRADAIVNVSGTFSEHVEKVTRNKAVFTISTGVDTDIFKKRPEQRHEVGEALGIASDAKVLVYSGSLGEKGWHSPGLLAEVFALFKESLGKAKLLIISRSDPRVISRRLGEKGLNKEDYVIVPGQTLEEVAYFLQRGDYAAFTYREISGKFEHIVSRSVIAIKTGEYLACGLPLIVNKNVGAASALVKKYGVGLVFDPNEVPALKDDLTMVEENYQVVSEKCQVVAREYFDYRNNAEKYLEIYDMLLGTT